MEELTLWVMQRAAKMPRAHKFTVGDRLVETCLEVTTSLVEASFKRDKRALLARASRGLTRARLLARLAHRLGLISEKQSLYFGSESTEVGKMLGGWKRSQVRRESPVEDTSA